MNTVPHNENIMKPHIYLHPSGLKFWRVSRTPVKFSKLTTVELDRLRMAHRLTSRLNK